MVAIEHAAVSGENGRELWLLLEDLEESPADLDH